MTANFDWWLLEYLAEHDPVSPPLLARELELDRRAIDRGLERLRDRDLARLYFSSRPVQWGITDGGRACLADSVDTLEDGLYA